MLCVSISYNIFHDINGMDSLSRHLNMDSTRALVTSSPEKEMPKHQPSSGRMRVAVCNQAEWSSLEDAWRDSLEPLVWVLEGALCGRRKR